MSIVGVGIDVVDIQRFERTLGRTPGMRTRLFTPAERQRPIASLAARFAAKEALAKALGAPAGLHWQHAEVLTAADGRPSLRLTGTVAERAGELGVTDTHLSLSHDAGIASAVVILERLRDPDQAPARAEASEPGTRQLEARQPGTRQPEEGS